MTKDKKFNEIEEKFLFSLIIKKIGNKTEHRLEMIGLNEAFSPEFMSMLTKYTGEWKDD